MRSKRDQLLLAAAALLLSLAALIAAGHKRQPAFNEHNIEVENIKVVSDRNRGFSQISGQITSHGSRSHNLELKMLFYSRDGGVVGRAKGMVYGLKPGVTRTFRLFTTTDIGGFVHYSLEVAEAS